MRYSFTGPTDILTEWDAESKIYKVVRSLTDVSEITTGGAYGVDTLAARVCIDYLNKNVHHRLCLPRGKWYNKQVLELGFDEIEYIDGGYMKRNDALVAHCDVLLAFPETEHEVLRSGTWSTIRRAYTAGKEVRIYALNL